MRGATGGATGDPPPSARELTPGMASSPPSGAPSPTRESLESVIARRDSLWAKNVSASAHGGSSAHGDSRVVNADQELRPSSPKVSSASLVGKGDLHCMLCGGLL